MISLDHTAAEFTRAISEIRGQSSLRSEQLLAVTQAAWSAANGRGYIARPPEIEAASEAWIAGPRLQKNRIYTRPSVVAPSWSGSGVPSKPGI